MHTFTTSPSPTTYCSYTSIRFFRPASSCWPGLDGSSLQFYIRLLSLSSKALSTSHQLAVVPVLIMDIRDKDKATLFVSGLTSTPTGPVTDYGATINHWQHHRTPNYKGGYTGEAERPSISYVVDVGSCPCLYHIDHTDSELDRFFPLRRGSQRPPTVFL